MYTFSQERYDAQKPNENWIANYLIHSGCFVVPFTDFANGSAPMGLYENGQDILPDFQVFDYVQKRQIFVEVKTADTSPFNRTFKCNVLGIKRYQWKSYLDIYSKTGIDILFVWFVSNKLVLTAQISRMEGIPCLCRSCRQGDECDAESLIYFPVEVATKSGCIVLNRVLTRARY